LSRRELQEWRKTDLVPLGDRGWLARFDREDLAARWAIAVAERAWPGVVDVVTAYRSVGVLADPERIDIEDLADRLTRIERGEKSIYDGCLIRIPVLYDGEDRDEAAATLGLRVDELIRCHSSVEYLVFAIGFQPGFPYAGYLPPALAGLPRRQSPRSRVPAGSVAIVGRQTAIYPSESPGGWHLLGRTPVTIVDMETGYFPIRAGDCLKFDPIGSDEFEARMGERL
jgi:KipI family sensor histidine kinase inhibitor